MTKFKETSTEVRVDDSVSFDSRNIFNPYDVEVAKDLITRSYKISSFSWTAATGVVAIPLIGALSQSVGALTLWKLFRLARCTFKIQFKMASSQYHQGSAMVGWLPNVLWSAVPQGVQSLSAYHAVVLSASKQESCTIIIPYCSPEDWMDTQNFTSISAEHATVFFAPLNTLLTTNSSVAASIPMEVYGNIETIDLSAAISQCWVKVEEIDCETIDMSDVEIQMSKNSRDKEAAAKATAGKDAAVGSVIRNTSQLVRRIPVIGAVWSPIADVINTIFSTELSKPITNAAPTNILQRYASDFNQADGLQDSTVLSLYQNPRVKVAPIMYGMDTSFKSLRKFAGEPMLFDQITYNGTTVTTYSTTVRPNVVGATIVTRDYLAITNRMFRFTRGSIKYLIHFCLPCFYSVRFRIRVQNIATITGDVGNVPSMVLDIKGDTWIPIIVPMVNYRPWIDQTFTDNEIISKLVIEQLTQIVGSPSPTTAVIYCNIFRAGGEDMQWSVPCYPGLIPTPTTSVFSGENEDMSKVQKQCSLKEHFKKQFEPIAKSQYFCEEEHAVMSETVKNVIDLLKRPATYPTATALVGQTSLMTAHKILMSSFIYQRGSIVTTLIHRSQTAITNFDGFYMNTLGYAPANFPDWTWANASETGKAMIQTESVSVPYFCCAPYHVTATSANYILGSSQRATSIGASLTLGTQPTITKNVGDDFVYMFQVPWANTLSYNDLDKKHFEFTKKARASSKAAKANMDN